MFPPINRQAVVFVEVDGVEPTTLCLQSRCSSQLSYTPIAFANIDTFIYIGKYFETFFCDMEIIYKDPHSGIMGETVEDQEPTAVLSAIEAKTPRVELRKARPSDATFIADTVLAAMGYDIFAPEALTSGTTPFGSLAQVRDALVKVCSKEDTLYSWKNTCIATYCGKVAGALVSYDGGTYKETAERTFSLISRLLNTDKPEPGEETGAGEYYLDSLAVHPDFRGHSIGSILIQNALEEAQALGYTRATLLVDKEKPYLHKLYEKSGFADESEVLFFGEPYIRMVQEI